jgi:signal transduction histidine kinase/CheY-like chemotaxis protein
MHPLILPAQRGRWIGAQRRDGGGTSELNVKPTRLLSPVMNTPASDTLAVLHALDRPAAIVGAGGLVSGNAAFDRLDADIRAEVFLAAPIGWRETRLPSGERLVIETAGDERLMAQERFLATLSHEIRTPLNGVLGMAGLLDRTLLDDEQQEYLRALRASGEHLLGLVNDVLDFAKLHSGTVELELAPTDLEKLLQGVCELLSPRAHENGIEIAWAVEPGVPAVHADDGRLRQILFNLAGNAVKLTKQGGVLLRAETRPSDAPNGSGDELRLRFTVRDTGPGLAADVQAKVFEEFVQTESGARAGGTGLGLAIVKRLAGAFGGEVGVESIPGEGACFWFEAAFAPCGLTTPATELAGRCVGVVSASPIVRKAAVAQVRTCGGEARVFATVDQAAAEAPRGAVLLVDADADKPITPPPTDRACLVLLAPEARSRIAAFRAAGYAGYLIKPLRRTSLAARVLATLDEQDLAQPAAVAASEDERAAPAGACGARVLLAEDNAVNALLARALLGREGCSIERVANGEEALEALAAAPFDIVLMDMRMPVMDGLTATRELRRRGIATPVVALTANAFEDDRRACLDAGMNDFLTKPIEVAALRAAVARWTGPQGAAKLTA